MDILYIALLHSYFQHFMNHQQFKWNSLSECNNNMFEKYERMEEDAWQQH